MSQTTSCCGCNEKKPHKPNPDYVCSRLTTSVGDVPQIKTRLTFKDRLGTLKSRWGFGRYHYRVEPGLYAVGFPSPESPVLVSANYKLTFDKVRSELADHHLWLLILDTKGINVWCAAGKGTFSSAELLRQIEKTRLTSLVSHRKLILPQLGAPGVSAHEVKKASGFGVVYGPVLITDLPRFLQNGQKATPNMRRVRFPLGQRLLVVPIELRMALKYFFLYTILVFGLLLLLGKMNAGTLMSLLIPPLGALLAGTILVPVLLPLVPPRSFVLKGLFIGITWWFISLLMFHPTWLVGIGTLLLLPVISALLALNFTGATTFTSQSGVNREIALFARPLGISALLGIIMLILGIRL